MSYDSEPRYPVVQGDVRPGYGALAAELVRRRPRLVAVDGPAALPWEAFAASLAGALGAAGLQSSRVDVRRFLAPWKEVQRRTATADLAGDPVFARSFEGSLGELFDDLPQLSHATEADLTLVLGPGSALVDHDLLWYADLPKRLSLNAVRQGLAGNLGQSPGEAGSEQRLLFVDWPVLDRHKQALASRIDCYVDLTDPDCPRSLDGGALRRSLHALAAGPFRTRPTFLPGPWGGQWLRRALGVATDTPNLAWSYELITPESGVLLGAAEPIEVAFELPVCSSRSRTRGAFSLESR